jgi:hypothetical protein
MKIGDFSAYMNFWFLGGSQAALVDELTHDPDDPSGIKPGEAAIVMADDYGREPLAGTLVAVNAERIIIARMDAALGRLHLHVPRVA